MIPHDLKLRKKIHSNTQNTFSANTLCSTYVKSSRNLCNLIIKYLVWEICNAAIWKNLVKSKTLKENWPEPEINKSIFRTNITNLKKYREIKNQSILNKRSGLKIWSKHSTALENREIKDVWIWIRWSQNQWLFPCFPTSTWQRPCSNDLSCLLTRNDDKCGT